MDTPPPVPQIVQCQCPHRRRWWSPIGTFFRFVGLLILLAVVFVAGVAIGGPGPSGGIAKFIDTDAVVPGENVMFKARLGGCGFGLSGGDRQFGVITAIAGQKVTIADNGGGTQTVLITSDTTVVDAGKEVPMWKLRVGNPVRVFGDTDEGVIAAELIEVVR